MRRLVAASAMCILTLVACGPDGDGAATPAPTESGTFEEGTAIIETDDEPVLLNVEIAQTDEQHALGLMNREHLAEDAGMVFLFFEEHRGGFWMKNTLIPLSVAFFDVDGKILKILDMVPCKKDPCKVYDPGVPYMGALEVNRGAFERLGVEPGDTVRVSN